MYLGTVDQSQSFDRELIHLSAISTSLVPQTTCMTAHLGSYLENHSLLSRILLSLVLYHRIVLRTPDNQKHREVAVVGLCIGCYSLEHRRGGCRTADDCNNELVGAVVVPRSRIQGLLVVEAHEKRPAGG